MRISAFLGQNKRYLVVFLLVIFFLISFATKYIDWTIYRIEVTKAATNDGSYYKDIAQQIAEGEKPLEYLYTRGLRPVFIFYLAILLKIFGYNSDFIISLINIIIISFFLTLLAYMVIKKYGSAGYWLSFIAAVIFIAGNPLILFFSPFILTDIPAMGILILGMFIYFEMNDKLKYILLGAVYALAFHVREVTFINFVALITTMLILKESKRNVGIVVFMYLVLVIPWLLYVYSYNSLSPFLSHLAKVITTRKVIFHTDNMPLYARFATNLFRHYYLYITDGGPIGTHGYYAIIYTLTMYVMGVVGGIILFIEGYKKEFYLIINSIFLTALFYGFVGEAPYMRGRVLVEYLFIYIAAVGLISSVGVARRKVEQMKG